VSPFELPPPQPATTRAEAERAVAAIDRSTIAP
jgi:hypothetical protein